MHKLKKRLTYLSPFFALILLAATSVVLVQAATLTLGNTIVGNQTDTNDSNFINGSRFTVGATGGNVTSMSVFVGSTIGNPPNNQYQVAIYSDASGTPGTLIASSASNTLTGNSWNTAPITAALQANTPYWLVYNTNGTKNQQNNLKFSSGGTSAFTSSQVSFGTWPSNFGSAVIGNANFSIYATYETAPAPSPTPTPDPTPTPTPVPTPSTTPDPSSTPTPGPSPTPPPPSTSTTPILIVTDPNNKFTTYYSEILKAEGFNSYATSDLSSVTATTLADYEVVILGEQSLTVEQVTMFETWVNAGGNLIAMRPDKKLASLLGVTDTASTMPEAYLLINTITGPGTGLVGETIQYHGTADKYTVNGADFVASLYSNATTPTTNPAVTIRSVGTNGGQAAAFTYDLARSIVLTRQGNPAWTGQNVNNVDAYEASEMFDGYHRGLPDWNNLSKAQIPIADEQQRLLANMILQMNADKKPLPHFWYFPRDLKAVVVMTGDDHGRGGTEGRFNTYIANSPQGCSVTNWECIRSSSYVSNSVRRLTAAEALNYTNLGFEVGLHVTTGCQPWGTAADLNQDYSSQLATWVNKYTSIPTPSSSRTHCVEWDDWATQPKTKLIYGMRLDTDYYYYPSNWVQGRIGLFNGTGLMMRFADLDGSLINVFQATTQMPDESGLSFPLTINTLLDNALGPLGYYGAFTANMHTDSATSAGSDAIVASAKARGVPVVSGRQMLQWLDGRDQSAFTNVTGTASSLNFTVTGGTNGLRAMIPAQSSTGGTITAITLNSSPVSYTTQTIKGISYAFFNAAPGSYQVTYSQ